jgi:hypothetical protein
MLHDTLAARRALATRGALEVVGGVAVPQLSLHVGSVAGSSHAKSHTKIATRYIKLIL